MDWIDAIRVSTHVKLEYNVDFIVDMIRDALKPFTDFPKNLDQPSSIPSSVDISIDPKNPQIQTSSLSDLPDLL